MTQSDRDRRRALAMLGGCLVVLAGCRGWDTLGEDGAAPTATAGDTSSPDAATPSDTPSADQGTGTEDDPPDATTSGPPRDVTFPKPGGGTVAATRDGDGPCGVVLVPQINMDRGSWEEYARSLADAGYLALAIDEGESRKDDGVAGAVEYLRGDAGASTVVVIGASSGGEAAVRASAATPETVDGLVTLSSSGGADLAGDLSMRSLFVVSEGDDDRFVRIANDLAAGAAGPTDLVVYDGDAHGQRILDSPNGEDLRSRLASFLEAVCPPAETA